MKHTSFKIVSILVVWLINIDFTQSWKLSSLKTFSYSNEHGVYSTERVTEIRRKYLQEEDTKWTRPSIANLNEYVAAVSGNLNCFIVVDNFQNINVNHENIPIILRYPQPFVQTYALDGWKYWRLVLGTSFIGSLNISDTNTRKNFPCSLPKYLIGLNPKRSVEDFFLKHLCLVLDNVEYFLHAKPTSCYTHFGLFPPQYIGTFQYQLVYPEMFSFVFERGLPHLYLPSTISPINTMVQYQQSNQELAVDSDIIMKWMEGSKLVVLGYQQASIFVALQVDPPAFQKHWLLTCAYIKSAIVFKICYHCRHENGKDYGTLTQTKLETFNLSVVARHAFPTAAENMVWYIPVAEDDTAPMRAMMKYSRTCKPNERYRKFWSIISSKSSSLDKVAIAHSSVWKSIMKNYTVAHACDKEERKNKGRALFAINVVESHYDKSLFVFPNYPIHTLTDLRFIGCGTQGWSLLAFSELVSVFDIFIWLGIATTITLVPISIKVLWLETNIAANIISVLKAILEQNDPFPGRVVNKFRLRCLLIPLLLMGAIISNAYKNTNVYKMVSPRKPVLYEYFNELMRDNFHVYTRSMLLFWHPENFTIFKNSLDVFVHKFPVYAVTETEVANGELQGLDLNETGSHEDSLLQKHGVMDAATLQPNVKSKFSRFLHAIITSTNENKTVDYYSKIVAIEEQYPRLQLIEEAELTRAVERCQRTAVILPEYMCLEVRRSLKQKRKSPYIFIGKESYTNQDWTFSLDGLVPFHVVKRIQGIAQSGIWQWWMQLLGENSVLGATEGQPAEAATMKGNIVVVFVLWACCVTLAIASILLEICIFRKMNCVCFGNERQKETKHQKNTAEFEAPYIKVKTRSS